jgi:arylamine N-acetyltransferase
MNIDEIKVEDLKRKLVEKSKGCCFTIEEVFNALAEMGFNSNQSQSVLQVLVDDQKIVIKRAIVFK